MAYYMEENLEMPLRKVLSIIQHRIMNQTTYFGVKALKNPFDYWAYQEILFKTKPDVIIEIGNANGGGTLALAHLCDLLDKGRVIGIDISHKAVPKTVKEHPRITLIGADACQCFEQVESLILEDERVLVIEDSSHTYDNTLNVLHIYSKLIKPGDYFIVEDSICHHGLIEGPKPGPYEAVEKFVDENTDFLIDRSRESFFITWNPKGYLRRKKFENEGSDSKTLSEVEKGTKFSAREIIALFIPPIIPILAGKIRRNRR